MRIKKLQRGNIAHIIHVVEPPNNGHVGDECFVHYSEFVPSSEVLTCIQLLAGGTQFVHCREVVHSSECPLSEVFHCILNSVCVCNITVCTVTVCVGSWRRLWGTCWMSVPLLKN